MTKNHYPEGHPAHVVWAVMPPPERRDQGEPIDVKSVRDRLNAQATNDPRAWTIPTTQAVLDGMVRDASIEREETPRGKKFYRTVGPRRHRFNVAKRTVYRMIEELDEHGVSVSSSPIWIMHAVLTLPPQLQDEFRAALVEMDKAFDAMEEDLPPVVAKSKLFAQNH